MNPPCFAVNSGSGSQWNINVFLLHMLFPDITLYVYDLELGKVLITHDVTWSRKDSFCRDQFVDEQPEEKPSVPVKISISQKTETPKKSAFAKFVFGGDRNE